MLCFATLSAIVLRKFVWFVPGSLVEWRTAPPDLRTAAEFEICQYFRQPRLRPGAHSTQSHRAGSRRVSRPHGQTSWLSLGSPRARFKRHWPVAFLPVVARSSKGDPCNRTSVTISDPDDAVVEFGEIDIPDGESPHHPVLMPSLAWGSPRATRPHVHKHWRLGHLQGVGCGASRFGFSRSRGRCACFSEVREAYGPIVLLTTIH